MGVDLMPFADNWAYLKTELAWLDRLLMLAVSRQRKETKSLRKVAATPADKVSSHWWKGVISVPNPAYDDCKGPKKPSQCKPVGYQQQLEGRIKASARDSTVLALPAMRNYLNLTLFEKNLILMALAPEVNRRYGRLYHFLQTGEDKVDISDLPTVDLTLRLLCRNDLERRRARAKLTAPQSLIERRILRYVSPRPSTRLNSYLQLSEDWVDYLLDEQPDQQVLFKRLASSPPQPVLALPAPTAATRAARIHQPSVTWDQLILPAPLLKQLQTIGQQASVGLVTRQGPGKRALLVGDRGTGKKMAAEAIAASLHQSLCIVDLQQVHPDDWHSVLTALDSHRYPALLIRSASFWFGRIANDTTQPSSTDLATAHLSQWLQARQQAPGITLLSTRALHLVKAKWRQQMDAVITLPQPYKVARKMLWRQAFSGIACDENLDWMLLAQQLKVNGGDIQQLAKAAVAIAQSTHARAVTLSHIQQAIKQKGLSVQVK